MGQNGDNLGNKDDNWSRLKQVLRFISSHSYLKVNWPTIKDPEFILHFIFKPTGY